MCTPGPRLTGAKMSISAVLTRFAFIYASLLVVGAIALSLLNVKSNSGINTALLLGAVVWACLSFARSNRRYFTPQEKSQVVWGMLGIDLVVQAALSFLLLLGTGSQITFTPWMLAILLIAVVHAVVIYFFVGFTGKQFEKENAKRYQSNVSRKRSSAR